MNIYWKPRSLIAGIVIALLYNLQASATWMINTVATLTVVDGELCFTGLVKGTNDCLYLVASAGGSNNLGTVFQVSPDGTASALWHFNGTNGAYPQASLVVGADGNLYGTTVHGGTGYDGTPFSGYGTAFRLTPEGTLTTLKTFDVGEGINPFWLTQASDGFFYGTTASSYSLNGFGFGTIFRMTAFGDCTTLFAFDGTNGDSVAGRLLEWEGDLYGTTWAGGVSNKGTIFRVETDGDLTTLVHFVGTNGANPFGLNLGSDGQFYGVTHFGGLGHGTIFRMTPGGALEKLHDFNLEDGVSPNTGLTLGADGALYGTTIGGGTPNSFSGAGTIFRVDTNGILSIVGLFNSFNGMNPNGELVHTANNCFYGTTSQGAWPNTGSIFRFGAALQPNIDSTRIVTKNGTDYLHFNWQGLGGVTYEIETNGFPDSSSWAAINVGTLLGNPTNSVLESPLDSNFWIHSNVPQLFFRVAPLPP